jgi:hypothetical protein
MVGKRFALRSIASTIELRLVLFGQHGDGAQLALGGIVDGRGGKEEPKRETPWGDPHESRLDRSG